MVHAVISPFQRRVAVGAAFVAAIALVLILNRRAPAGDSPVEPQFHLTNIAPEAVMKTALRSAGTTSACKS